jgi:ligand-binding sensor domain-containing protein/AraC-like DNA-binding protein/FixJ family two-component response regulator
MPLKTFATGNNVSQNSGVERLPAMQFISYTQANSALSFDGIRTVVEDSRGYIWIGTYKGLNRFDGFRFKTYGSAELGVASDYICSLGEDADGNLWIGTDAGVVVYRYDADSFEPLRSLARVEAEPTDRVFAIARDSSGTMWLGSRSGLYRCDPHRRVVSRVALAEASGRAVSYIYRLAVAPGALYLASYCNNIFRFEPSSGELREVSSRYRGDDIEGLQAVSTPSGDDVLYVAGKRTGLTRIRRAQMQPTGATQHQPSPELLFATPQDHRPTQLSVGRDSTLYLATTGGLLQFDCRTGSHALMQHLSANRFSLTDSYVTDVLTDSHGSLWVGTQGGGLCRADRRLDLFRKIYHTADGVPLNACGVTALAEDGDGTLWIATARHGLLRLGPTDDAPTHYVNASIPLAITALFCEHGQLWIGAQQGVVRLNPVTGETHAYRELGGDNRIVSFYRPRHTADGLWAATATGIARYDASADNFRVIEPLRGLTVESMAEDKEGRIWLATYSDGVYYFDPQTNDLKQYCTRVGNCSVPEMISSLCIDSRGHLWVASFGSGLFLYDQASDTFVVPSRDKSNLSDRVILSIEPDGKDYLWLSTTRGLVRLNTQSGTMQCFTTADGLLDNSFRKASLHRSDGTLAFGSENGLIVLHPTDLTKAMERTRPMMISDIHIDGNALPRGNADVLHTLTLRPGENSFDVSFASPGEVAVRSYERLLCRLDGHDAEWRDVTASMSTDFFGLKPGTYRLQLHSVGPDGTETEARPDLTVRVEPRFFESSLGLLLILVFFGLITAAVSTGFYRRAVRREKARHAEALREATGDIDRLTRLMGEFEEFIEAESKECVTTPRTVNLGERLGLLCAEYASELPEPFTLRFEEPQEPVCVRIDDRILDRIFDRLLVGARRYAERQILVGLRCDESGQAEVRVGFDGACAADEASLFKPVVNGAGGDSCGLELPLAHRLTELSGGRLTLAPEGNAFLLQLTAVAPDAVAKASDTSEAVAPDGKQTVLLVEPSEELAEYLRRHLGTSYRVITVATAAEALGLLRDEEIYLVLVDATLADMHVAEFCRRATTDFETSHVPVAVIGSANATDLKRDCMVAGASIYVEKPFALDYLHTCVEGIITRRAQWRQAIETSAHDSSAAASEPVATTPFSAESDSSPNLDEQFLRRMEAVIAERMSNPDFSSKQLAEELCLSYSSLNRKVKALLDMTPNDYLRKKRLAAAVRMLQSSGSRVGEVGHQVGFASSSYFAKCFKEEYGILPGEARRPVAEQGAE